MRMGKIPKAVVEQDFSYIVKNFIHKKLAKQLSNEWENENIRFQVTRAWDLMVKPTLVKGKEDV